MATHEIRQATRYLRRNSRFSLAVISNLALGIGMSVGVFNIIGTSLLTPHLGVASPDRLAFVTWSAPNGLPDRFAPSGYVDETHGASFSLDTYRQISKATGVSAAVGFVPMGFGQETAAVGVHGQNPRMSTAVMVTGNYFTGLGVHAALGRALVEADEREDGAVAVISDAYWSKVFARAPGAIGQMLSLNGSPYTIVGVAPSGFTGLEPGFPTEIWLPLRTAAPLTAWSAPATVLTEPDSWAVMIVVRVRDGLSHAQLEPELQHLFEASIAAGEGAGTRPPAYIAVRLSEMGREISELRDHVRQPLLLLFVLALILLGVGLLNITILWLQRLIARDREIAMRLALGATRANLVRQLVVEALVLATASVLPGLLLGLWCARLLHTLGSRTMAAQGISIPQPEFSVWSFALAAAIAIAASLIVAVACSRRTRRTSIGVLLRGATRSRAEPWIRWRQRMVAAAQATLVFVLLAGARSLAVTCTNLVGQLPAERLDALLTFSIRPPGGMITPRAADALLSLCDQIGQQSEVAAASTATFALLEGRAGNAQIRAADGRVVQASLNVVGPTFFRAAGVPILRGRDFETSDGRRATRVVVVNQALAERLFGTAEALGREVSLPMNQGTATVVGVVVTEKFRSLREPPVPSLYVPMGQSATLAGFPRISFLVRTVGDPQSVVPVVRKLVANHFPGEAITDVFTGRQRLERAVARERALATFAQVTVGVALLLGIAGISAVSLFAVAERKRDIGIRMALGASIREVVTNVVLSALIPVAAGVMVGVPSAVVMLHEASALLFDVVPFDVGVLTTAGFVVICAALVGTAVPALQAARVDPTAVLKGE